MVGTTAGEEATVEKAEEVERTRGPAVTLAATFLPSVLPSTFCEEAASFVVISIPLVDACMSIADNVEDEETLLVPLPLLPPPPGALVGKVRIGSRGRDAAEAVPP